MAKEVKPGDPQSYRVQMQAATGRMTFVDVVASTGDEAAAKALVECPGGRVGHVEPTPQAPVARKKLSLPAGETMVEIDGLGPDAKVVA